MKGKLSEPYRRFPDPERKSTQALLLAVIAASVWFVYRPGLAGPFIFDDFQIFVHNPFVPIENLSLRNLQQGALSLMNGWFSRPIPMLSFSLNYFFADQSFDRVAFKATNVVIHMLNAALVYFFVRSLLLGLRQAPAGAPADDARSRAVLISALTAAVWALHPVNFTSVLYTVQRMNSLSAMFVLLGALAFVHGRRTLPHRPRRGFAFMSGGISGGVILGFLCKENAVLLPLMLVPVELVFFRREQLSRRIRRGLGLFYSLFIGLPALAGIAFLTLNFDFVLDSYRTRDFDLVERLLTESRVLFFYLSLIIAPVLGRFGFYHDDFVLSTGLSEPVTTFVALAGWAVLLVLLVRGLRPGAVWAFGLAWFIAGHALESTLLGLELVHEHRNYVPGIGIFVALIYHAANLIERFRLSTRLAGACALCVILVFGFVTYTRAGIWSSQASMFEFMARHHPQSYRALSNLAASMMDQQRDARAVYATLRDAAQSNPTTVYPLIHMTRLLQALLTLSSESGRPVAPGGEPPDPDAWKSNPVLDGATLARMDRALSNEVLRRLRTHRVHTETVFALLKAQQCAINGRVDCAGLIDRLAGWHRVVLEKPDPLTPHRAWLELSLAKLYVAQGDIETGLALVDRAIGSAGGTAPFRIQKALLLVKLGAIDDAQRIADEVERDMDWRQPFARELALLRREIQAATRAGPPSRDKGSN
ncbi:MAG: hypothetical protein R3174_04020 [Gammaproteobacteria bacterium]|nr:hypothetical protein [Gammaproteobacteria bacterium]